MEKILVIDNHAVTLKYLEMLLGKEGYEVRTAQDGIEALDIIKDFKPDLFFVDLVMPYIRGEKLIPILRNIKEVQEAKIVVLSGIAAEVGSEHLAFGADACIAKAPFNKMGKYILDLLDSFKKGEITGPIQDVIGVDDVYKRAVTTELVAGRRHTDVILNNISDGIIELNRDHRIVFENTAAMEFLKSTETDIISASFESFWREENASIFQTFLQQSMEQKDSGPVTVQKDDSFYEVHARYLVTENDETCILIMKDITLLQKELIEKDAMIKEVYHRVKNNLALISSIVNLQIGDSSDVKERDVLQGLKNRIDSIALIHSKIFRSKNPDLLPLRDYLEELFATLVYSEVEREVSVSYDVSVPDVEINIDYAVPLGLIITELCTNALKYAFQGKQTGTIVLLGNLTAPDTLSFVFRSNSSANPLYFSFSKSTLLSLRIVEALVLQLQSDIHFTEENGAVYSFSIHLQPGKH